MKNNSKTLSLRGRLYLRFDRFRADHRISLKGWKLKISIPERYEKIIKLIRWIITIIGLVSAFFVFGSMFIAFIFGVVLYVLSWIFEHFVFIYKAIYVTPVPDFVLDSSKWVANVFGWLQSVDKEIEEVPVVGPVFNDIEYGKKIHELIFKWSREQYEDEEKNVSVSATYQDDSYVFYIYPSYEREPAQKAFENFKSEVKAGNKTNEASMAMFAVFLGRKITIGKNSMFHVFRKQYVPGTPFFFSVHYSDGESEPRPIQGLRPFVFYNLKIKRRDELTRKDVEYGLLKVLR